MRNARWKRNLLRFIFAALICIWIPRPVFAHAVLEHSTPADHSVVRGPDVNIVLHYNSRVDARRSSLAVVNAGPGHTKAMVEMQPQKSPDELCAHAHLTPGKYEILWQALATDGHLTRGIVTFTVR